MTVIAVPDSRLDAAPFEAVAHQVLPAITAFDALQSRTGSGARLALNASAPGVRSHAPPIAPRIPRYVSDKPLVVAGALLPGGA